MRYFDVYKKRASLHGTSYKEIALNKSKQQLNDKFATILGHTEALLNFKDEIDFVHETTSNVFVSSALLRPDTLLNSGDYLTFNHKTWIVRSLNSDKLSPEAELYLCNQTFRLKGVEEPIYCYSNSSTFGTKGVEDTGKFNELDSKTRLYFQHNAQTEQIKVGHRLMFMNRYVYKINEIDDLVYPGMFIATCSIESHLEMDDFENNLAYNEGQPMESASIPASLEIDGVDQLKKSTTERFTVEGDWVGEWSLDDESYATLQVINEREVELTTLKKSGWIELRFSTTHPTNPFEVYVATKEILIY